MQLGLIMPIQAQLLTIDTQAGLEALLCREQRLGLGRPNRGVRCAGRTLPFTQVAFLRRC
eukprot:12787754-Prorocentrum_lima.AAC.1